MAKHMWLDARFLPTLNEKILGEVSRQEEPLYGIEDALAEHFILSPTKTNVKVGDQLFIDATTEIMSPNHFAHILGRLRAILKSQSENLVIADPTTLNFIWDSYKEELSKSFPDDSRLESRSGLRDLIAIAEKSNISILDFERKLQGEFFVHENVRKYNYRLDSIGVYRSTKNSENFQSFDALVDKTDDEIAKVVINKDVPDDDGDPIYVGLRFVNGVGNTAHYMGYFTTPLTSETDGDTVYEKTLRDFLSTDYASLELDYKTMYDYSNDHDYPIFFVSASSPISSPRYRFNREAFNKLNASAPFFAMMIAAKTSVENVASDNQPGDPTLYILDGNGRPFDLLNRYPKHGYFLQDLSEEAVEKMKEAMKQYEEFERAQLEKP